MKAWPAGGTRRSPERELLERLLQAVRDLDLAAVAGRAPASARGCPTRTARCRASTMPMTRRSTAGAVRGPGRRGRRRTRPSGSPGGRRLVVAELRPAGSPAPRLQPWTSPMMSNGPVRSRLVGARLLVADHRVARCRRRAARGRGGTPRAEIFDSDCRRSLRCRRMTWAPKSRSGPDGVARDRHPLRHVEHDRDRHSTSWLLARRDERLPRLRAGRWSRRPRSAGPRRSRFADDVVQQRRTRPGSPPGRSRRRRPAPRQ